MSACQPTLFRIPNRIVEGLADATGGALTAEATSELYRDEYVAGLKVHAGPRATAEFEKFKTKTAATGALTLWETQDGHGISNRTAYLIRSHYGAPWSRISEAKGVALMAAEDETLRGMIDDFLADEGVTAGALKKYRKDAEDAAKEAEKEPEEPSAEAIEEDISEVQDRVSLVAIYNRVVAQMLAKLGPQATAEIMVESLALVRGVEAEVASDEQD